MSVTTTNSPPLEKNKQKFNLFLNQISTHVKTNTRDIFTDFLTKMYLNFSSLYHAPIFELYLKLFDLVPFYFLRYNINPFT